MNVKDTIEFSVNDIILNGKKHILTPGMWRLLTQPGVPKQDFDKEDHQKCAKILIETDAIYKNHDKSTERANWK